MLWELEGVVKYYYLWTKITESSIIEMHANKRHGCEIVCTHDTIYDVKFDNDNMISCISLSHNMKTIDIVSSYASYLFDEQGKTSSCRIWVSDGVFLVNLLHANRDVLSSAFTDIDGKRIGTSVVSNNAGEYRLIQHPK